MTPTLTPYGQALLVNSTLAAVVGPLADALSDTDPADAVTQLQRAGWTENGSMTLSRGTKLTPPQLRYGGKPAVLARASWKLGRENVWLFDAKWVAVIVGITGAARIGRLP